MNKARYIYNFWKIRMLLLFAIPALNVKELTLVRNECLTNYYVHVYSTIYFTVIVNSYIKEFLLESILTWKTASIALKKLSKVVLDRPCRTLWNLNFMHKNILASLFGVHNIISLSRHEQVTSPIKHTSLWHNKFIIFWKVCYKTY